jgi:dynactin 4
MSRKFPYIYIACPCTDSSIPTKGLTVPLPARPYEGDARRTADEREEEEEHTFDPRNPRANFSLYPLEHLLFCEDCQEIRCVRCCLEEIVCWFCPSCLFEVPGSVAKSEGNRCEDAALPRQCRIIADL